MPAAWNFYEPAFFMGLPYLPPAGNHSGKGESATKRARPPRGTANARRFSAAPRPAQPGDARGEAPCKKKAKNLPLPAGKGVRGMGARKQAKGSVGRWQRGHAPRRVPRRQGEPATKKASSRRVPLTLVEPVPRPVQPRGCKGRSPLHNKTKNLPLPRRGRGVGGWGQTNKLKVG